MASDDSSRFSLDDQTLIDSIVDGELHESGTPGALVALSIPGRGATTRAYGIGNLETGAPPTTEDHVRIASITKTFVATLLLQMVDEGRIGLDMPLSEFDFDLPNARSSTLAQLLGMTSGIFSYTEDEAFEAGYSADPSMPYTPDDALAAARSHDPYFAPGEGFHYSDTNYIIAGKIAERLTGSNLPDLVSERILVPQQLTATTFPVNDPSMPAPSLDGYMASAGGGPVMHVTESNPDAAWAAGALVSNLGDLVRWSRMLVDGTLLSAELQQRRLQTVPIAPESPASYGLGIMEIGGFYGHNGGIAGYSTMMLRDPVDMSMVVVATNLAGEQGGSADAIAMALLKAFLPTRFGSQSEPVATGTATPVSS